MSTIPWTYEPRPDTRATNVRVGMWLFLASEAMLFASLLSAYVMLRTGAASWPQAGTLLDMRQALINTGLLALATLATVWLTNRMGRAALVTGAALAIGFVIVKLIEYQSKLGAGLHPSTNLLLACWFTLTGIHAFHVAAGAAANLWVAAGGDSVSPQTSERLKALRLYWGLVDLVWVAILIGFYVY